jgi:hypothetical protein
VVDFTRRAPRRSPSARSRWTWPARDGKLLRATGDLEDRRRRLLPRRRQLRPREPHHHVTLSDGNTARVRLLSIGGAGVSAFAGINGGTDDAVGLQLGTVDFALALMSDVNDPSLHYTSLQATAALASFIGVTA